MNKYLPYILIASAIIFGFFLKDYLGLSSESQEPVKNVVVGQSNNKIDNKFETLLIYPKKNPIANFVMVDQNNKPFNNANFEGYWNLIFSGYTNCPDVCPNTLNQMVQLYKLMDKKQRDQFRFIFLSVDPERDTPEHLKQYLDFFSQDFVGISGNVADIDVLIKSLGGIYSINKQEGEFYTVDHSARIFIVGPNGERFGIVAGGAINAKDKNQLVKDLASLAI